MDTVITNQSHDDALPNAHVQPLPFGSPFNGNAGAQNESSNEVTSDDQQQLSEKF